jgi:hypothetical protein
VKKPKYKIENKNKNLNNVKNNWKRQLSKIYNIWKRNLIIVKMFNKTQYNKNKEALRIFS